MEKIFHYTSIQSLALILHSRKIRFSRLDGVDDIREAQTHAGINFGQYFFVSCWTKEEEESIPQWHMYGNNMQGVRIQMPEYPFRRVNLPKGQIQGIQILEDTVGPLSLDESFGNNYIVLPLYFDDFFCGPVNYVNNIEEHYISSIRKTVSESGNVNLQISSLPTLPRLKSNLWAFQNEYRFHLLVLPTSQSTLSSENTVDTHKTDTVSHAFLNNIAPNAKFIDVLLSTESLDEMIITMGPKSTPADWTIVEALLQKHAPQAKIQDSALAGTVR